MLTNDGRRSQSVGRVHFAREPQGRRSGAGLPYGVPLSVPSHSAMIGIEMENPILDYARPAHRKSGLRWADVLVMSCFLGACWAGALTFIETQHRPLTRARLQYEETRVIAQSTRPSYVPPPF